MPSVRAVAFDVIETLFSLDPIEQALQSHGLNEVEFQHWLSRSLRDGFCIAAAGGFGHLRGILRVHLAAMLKAKGHEDPRSTADSVLNLLHELPPQPDAAATLERVQKAGIGVVTLDNMSAQLTRQLLTDHGLSGQVHHCLDAGQSGFWKPCAEPYYYAVNLLGVPRHQLALVSVHPWDIHGAKQAGLRAAWVNRLQTSFPDEIFHGPDFEGYSLSETVDALLGEGTSPWQRRYEPAAEEQRGHPSRVDDSRRERRSGGERRSI